MAITYNLVMPESNPQRPMRRWKRTAAAALLLLAGGAVVNVAVAWGCTYAGLRSLPALAFGVAGGGWGVPAPWEEAGDPIDFSWLKWPADCSLCNGVHFVARAIGVDVEHFNSGCRLHNLSVILSGDRVVSGLPIRCLHGMNWESTTTILDVDIDWMGRGAIALAPGSGRLGTLTALGIETPYWLPAQPIWPGFIINTLFYALLLWLLFFAPFAARRMLRRRRGQCEKCAYPIGTWGGSPVCTECGAAVPTSVARPSYSAEAGSA